MTRDLSNLSIHSEYDGTDEVVIGDESGLPVSHVGSLSFTSSNRIFHLKDTLCVPTIKKNLISVHNFTKHNDVYLEFHPSYFLVKDRITGVTLLKGACEDGVYSLPEKLAMASKNITAYVHERTTTDGWHKRLGHPSSKIVNHLIRAFSLPTNKNANKALCNTCSQNKAHCQPFHSHGLTSQAPLELIYTDVWGPSHDIGLDGSKYYLIFIDHYTKYIWLYPMSTKSSVQIIFPQFQHLVENRFNTHIKSLYSDNGGEYIALKSYFSVHGIGHYTTAPHTTQQNGMSESRHRHLVETGLTLLTDANLPRSYWPYAFQTAAYLINRMPTATLNNQTPFEKLFNQTPNYIKLKQFGCLCFPLTRPYNKHKLEPKAKPCIFVGYSLSQNAYLCLEPTTHRVYHSRHVLFDESKFPFAELCPKSREIRTTPPFSADFDHPVILSLPTNPSQSL